MGRARALVLIPFASPERSETADEVRQAAAKALAPHQKHDREDRPAGVFFSASVWQSEIELPLPAYMEYGDEMDWQICPTCAGTGKILATRRKVSQEVVCVTCFGAGNREKWRLAENIVAAAILPPVEIARRLWFVVDEDGQLRDRSLSSEYIATASPWPESVSSALSAHPHCWAVIANCRV